MTLCIILLQNAMMVISPPLLNDFLIYSFIIIGYEKEDMMTLWYDKKAYALLKKYSDNQDMRKWNSYRVETKHEPINLRFSNLENFYLLDADLRNVDFRGSRLAGAKFHGADVDDANISTGIYWIMYFGAIVLSFIFVLGLYLIAAIDTEVFAFAAAVAHFYVILAFLSVLLVFLLATLVSDIDFTGVVGVASIAIIGGIVGVGVAGVAGVLDGIGGVSGIGGVFVTTGVIVIGSSLIKYFISGISFDICMLIAYAKNPEKVIGFNTKYLKDISIPLSSRSYKEISLVKELLTKEINEKEKKKLRHKLEELEKEKENALRQEAYAKTQQIKIQNALNHILKPYAYIERNISKLRRHNYFFYGLIAILLGTFIYALAQNYLDTRGSHFLAVLDKKSVSFGAIFGVILFYATPILFGMSIIIYAVNQINKNIQTMESMQEQRRFIEVLQSTLLAQTEIADVSDDEIKSLTQALQKGALERMFGQVKSTEKTPKETSSYREKLLVNNLSKVFTQALKIKP